MNLTTGSFAGSLLIAMPNLADPNFWQSVVLLGVHSDEEGAFGLIILGPRTPRNELQYWTEDYEDPDAHALVDI